MPSVKELGPDDCVAEGYASSHAGLAYETIAVNPRLYCMWLLRECEQCAAAQTSRLEKRTLRVESLLQALDEVPGANAVMNCTGLRAGELVGDEACFPTFGQTVLVNGKAHRMVTRRNEGDQEPWEALVIPWPGEEKTVLGGCKLEGEWCTEPKDHITRTILDRCRPLAPELLDQNGDFEVLEVRVGLRPSRKQGPRVEVEALERRRYVVHNYGHHSAGFEGSVGAAEEATALLLGVLG